MATIAKPKPKHRTKTKFNDDVIKRREAAAKHPGVREFDRLCAEAAKLSQKMNTWLVANDRPEDTPTVMALEIVAQNEFFGESDLGMLFTQLRGMQWALQLGTEYVEAFVIPSLFPEVCRAIRG